MLRGLDRPYELILVDDGSTDGTFEALAALHGRDPRVVVIRFRRNFGQTAAFAAGFDRARGRVIVTLDGDLQNDPRDIPALVARLEDGFDLVSGWRRERADRWLTRRVPSQCANWLISLVTGVKLHDYGCSLKAYRADGDQAGAAVRRAAPVHSRAGRRARRADCRDGGEPPAAPLRRLQVRPFQNRPRGCWTCCW